MEHIMKLHPKYFEYIKSGTKRIEIRLNDDKRKDLNIGDKLIFKKEPKLTEELHTKITGLIKKKSFKELVDSLDICEYADKNESKEQFLEDLHKFYSKEEEEKYGVVGIVIDILPTSSHFEVLTKNITSTINNPIQIKKEYLYNINLKDDFFNTLREDYFEFDKWFIRKQHEENFAYITVTKNNNLSSFLMLKEENEQENYSDFELPLIPAKRIKVSTFKVSDTGKKIGEYFIKIIIDEAIHKNINEIYVTTFEKQTSLIYLLEKHGFKFWCYRNTKKGDGNIEKEAIYIKNLLN